MRRIITVLFLLSFAATLSAGVTGTTIEYTADGVTLKGYLAYNEEVKDKRPGVLVVHEWWGLNDYARMRADKLAELGYVALALDMYGEGTTADHPEDAGRFSSEVMKNMPAMAARFRAGLDILKKHPAVDARRIGAIGYCFGGAVVLSMARAGIDLRGVVSFHGSLATRNPAEPGIVKAKVMVCNGGDDKFVPAEDIAAFRAEMKKAKVDYKFLSYENAKHSFTNPAATEYGEKFGMDIAYNEKADKKSWEDMSAFLRKVFGR